MGTAFIPLAGSGGREASPPHWPHAYWRRLRRFWSHEYQYDQFIIGVVDYTVILT